MRFHVDTVCVVVPAWHQGKNTSWVIIGNNARVIQKSSIGNNRSTIGTFSTSQLIATMRCARRRLLCSTETLPTSKTYYCRQLKQWPFPSCLSLTDALMGQWVASMSLRFSIELMVIRLLWRVLNIPSCGRFQLLNKLSDNLAGMQVPILLITLPSNCAPARHNATIGYPDSPPKTNDSLVFLIS
jgi:hypothetical protein